MDTAPPRTSAGGRTRFAPAADASLAAALAVVGVITTPFLGAASGTAPVDATALALVTAAAAATALRRRWPEPVLAVVALVTSGYLVAGYPYGAVLLSFGVATYAVARHRSARRAAAWCAGAFLVLAAHLLTSDAALPGLLGLVPASAWVVVPGTLGALRRLAVEAGARQVAQEQRERLQAERLVIAQEVHDIVGHGLAAIRMQADIALHVRATRPEQAELALAAISRTSADALDELRATLVAIGPLDGEGWPPPRAVTPGLGRISALCERTRSAGVEVDLTTTGPPGPVDPAVDVAAYRVVQECLTNVVKHSAHRHADVRVDQDPGSVTVRVTNRLPAGGAGPEGFGIAGMRRRVGEVGGHLSAGPDEDGTFTVTARIPTGPRSDR